MGSVPCTFKRSVPVADVSITSSTSPSPPSGWVSSRWVLWAGDGSGQRHPLAVESRGCPVSEMEQQDHCVSRTQVDAHSLPLQASGGQEHAAGSRAGRWGASPSTRNLFPL